MSSIKNLPTGTWAVDASHTEVGFVARHLMVTKVRGSFPEVSGTVTVAEDVTASTVDVTVGMASVDTRSADRDAHLRSADFFDVENYPTMRFVSTSFDGEELSGELTIKDVTKPVTFEVDFNGVQADPWGNTKAGFEAETEINRKDWGLAWNAAIEGGGVLVSEKIKIVLDVQLLKQA
ncbi:YceI family protein [Nostocoides vanveenii]|uniref:YceI family protein n=1 Tax=Nostocoides vanveenii TaxID=330835 RepID=A0ABP4WHG4_9MICO